MSTPLTGPTFGSYAGDEALLWQVVGGVFTWSRVADLLARLQHSGPTEGGRRRRRED